MLYAYFAKHNNKFDVTDIFFLNYSRNSQLNYQIFGKFPQNAISTNAGEKDFIYTYYMGASDDKTVSILFYVFPGWPPICSPLSHELTVCDIFYEILSKCHKLWVQVTTMCSRFFMADIIWTPFRHIRIGHVCLYTQVKLLVNSVVKNWINHPNRYQTFRMSNVWVNVL